MATKLDWMDVMTGIVVVWNLFGLDVLDINCHYEARVGSVLLAHKN